MELLPISFLKIMKRFLNAVFKGIQMKRFLNVVYKGIHTRINVTDMEDFSQLQKATEGLYVKTFPEIDGLRIQFFDQEDKQIDDFDDIDDKYYNKRKEGGLELVIKLLPSPAQSSQANLSDGNIS